MQEGPFDPVVQLGLEKMALASPGGRQRTPRGAHAFYLLFSNPEYGAFYGERTTLSASQNNSFKQTNETATIILPILQIRKLRHRSIMSPPRSHSQKVIEMEFDTRHPNFCHVIASESLGEMCQDTACLLFE